MKVDLLQNCVIVNGRRITSAPTVAQFLSAIDRDRSDCRFFPNPKVGNTLGTVDDLGIIFLYAEATEVLHMFSLFLDAARWRRRTERDPERSFDGELRVGGRPVPLPLTTSMAELIRHKRFDAYNLMFTPQDATIASVMITFDARAGKQGEAAKPAKMRHVDDPDVEA